MKHSLPRKANCSGNLLRGEPFLFCANEVVPGEGGFPAVVLYDGSAPPQLVGETVAAGRVPAYTPAV